MTTARDFIRFAPGLQADVRRLDAMGAIRDALRSSDDLRKPEWRGHPHPMAGHCYVASEALWHVLGGMQSEWRPEVLDAGTCKHWYLRSKRTRLVLDVTGDQFETQPPYENGRGCGFLTKQPSKRAAELIKRARLDVARFEAYKGSR